ncbi:TPA: hypothetical protein ACXE8V_000205 [Pluralibacter gergoviae]
MWYIVKAVNQTKGSTAFSITSDKPEDYLLCFDDESNPLSTASTAIAAAGVAESGSIRVLYKEDDVIRKWSPEKPRG